VLARYGLALAVLAGATALRFAIAPQEAGLPYVTYFPAVTLAAIFCGLAPAAMTTVLAMLLAAYLFVAPFSSFEVKPEAWLGGAVFCAEETLVCLLIEAMRRYYRKSAEATAALEQARAAEHAARLEAERANEAKSRFLAAASHDLRQPYQALRLFHAALLSQDIPAGTKDTILSKMDMAMTAGEELLNSLLDLSTLDAGVVTPKWSDADVAQLVATLEARHRPVAEGRGLRFRVHAVAARVHTDPVLLGRILDNLIANAIRYTPAGGILLAARRRRNAVAIEVWDTGIGIAPEHRQAVFEEFYQVSNVERDRGKGTGIGLAIAAKTARLMGCTLELASREGHGTRFRVVIPAQA
jgi:signal transduction histidine kinase